MTKTPYPYEIADRRFGFLGVAGPVVEDIMVGRDCTKKIGAGERPKEEHPMFKRKGERHCRRRRADIPDDPKNMIAIGELLHCIARPARLVSIIR